MPASRIAILGASGLIGYSVALDLLGRGFQIVAVARSFTKAQRHALGLATIQSPIVGAPGAELWQQLTALDVDVMVNCVGVLQDSPSAKTDQVHRKFVGELAALCAQDPKKLLIHLSVPGDAQSDVTAFSRSKRTGEALICASGAPYVILRPGFVLAPAAYGGSGLVRAAAMLPVRLPRSMSQRPLAVTDVAAISETIAWVIGR